MFEHLMASTTGRDRPMSSSLLAIACHAVLIGCAVLVTRGAVLAAPASPTTESLLPYLARSSTQPATAAAPARASVPVRASLPIAPVDMQVPLRLPPSDFGTPHQHADPAWLRAPDHDPFTPRGAPLYAVPTDSLRAAHEVDEQVRWMEGPRPVYPEVLRAAGVEGVVRIRMVVDTSGRVEPTSIRVQHSSHTGFEAAAREAVLGARFAPARLRGIPVRQVVEQSVRFAIADRP